MSLLRRLTTLLTSVGILSCGGAAAGWQSMSFSKIGTLRLRHPHTLTSSDSTHAAATVRTLIQWTHDRTWDPLRVEVDETHPLVIQLKAGPLLVLTPADSSLPIIWLSLEKDHRALLEDRTTGGLSIHALPPGKSLDLRWLGL